MTRLRNAALQEALSAITSHQLKNGGPKSQERRDGARSAYGPPAGYYQLPEGYPATLDSRPAGKGRAKRGARLFCDGFAMWAVESMLQTSWLRGTLGDSFKATSWTRRRWVSWRVSPRSTLAQYVTHQRD